MTEATPEIEQYFSSILDSVNKCYDCATKARTKDKDPEQSVDIPLAENLSERVEGLVSALAPQIKKKGIPQRIEQLEKQFGKLDWRVALTISLEVAQQKFCTFPSTLKAMETGIRVGLAYLTLGVVASPLEGFVELQLKKRKTDGKEYFALRYSGPIRSAGGTAGAVSLIIADHIRKKMGYATYDPTEQEIRRTIAEVYDYHDRVTNLQYLPSEKELWSLAENLPLQVDGDPSEKIEVSNYKDLDRIETNQIRSGMCLVIGECIAQKASKVWKQLSQWGKDYDLTEWNFLTSFLAIQSSAKSSIKESTDEKITPVNTYIKDLVAGRPVLSHPMQPGGFRLRYGRGRTSGYSAACIHPATMIVLEDYLAIGTQLKVERPGKATTLNVCDTLEGPIVKLKSGQVLQLETQEQAKQYNKQITHILFLGDILFSFGDFLNRAHPLVPPGYCEEWWYQELCLASNGSPTISSPFDPIDATQAIELSTTLNIPLHPKYTYHWKQLNPDSFTSLIQWISKGNTNQEKTKIVLNFNPDQKQQLERIGIPHSLVNEEFVIIQGDPFISLYHCLHMQNPEWEKTCIESLTKTNDVLKTLNTICVFPIKDKSGVFIGARMGRPEKAKLRKLTGSPHGLFPVGEEGGRFRSIQSSIEEGTTKAEFNTEWLNQVEKHYGLQHQTLHESEAYKKVNFDIPTYFSKVCKELHITVYPDLIKGIRGTSNKGHIPEHLAKGILRAAHDVHVNKDGTVRYDATQLPITHFTPSEIGTSIEQLKSLGYSTDMHGQDLVDPNQVIELKPQDIIAPACQDSPDEGANNILFKVGNFVDDALTKLYQDQPFYNFSSPSDVVGHLVMVLAPHTSAAIVGRIIGFSNTQGLFAHPMLHAATRRDCDGDEASITLLLDGLLNFSRQYLPSTRGATQDAPLVLTSKITPAEVDDMFFDLDVASFYPLEFYKACEEFKDPWDVRMDIMGKRINTPQQYQELQYTHPTQSINKGVRCSSYKLLPSMQEKLTGQMILAEKINAVDTSDVARLVIEKHLIRDIRGNLRKFSTQQFRCVKCNTKFRRPPLAGKCTSCEGKLLFTVSEGSIVKYLEPAISLAEKYDLPPYLIQTLQITKMRVEENFGKEKEKQEALGRWFG